MPISPTFRNITLILEVLILEVTPGQGHRKLWQRHGRQGVKVHIIKTQGTWNYRGSLWLYNYEILSFLDIGNFLISCNEYAWPTLHVWPIITHVDCSRGREIGSSPCLSVFRTLSQKPMQPGSPNLTQKCPNCHDEFWRQNSNVKVTRMDGQAELAWVVGYTPRWYTVYPPEDGHPSEY